MKKKASAHTARRILIGRIADRDSLMTVAVCAASLGFILAGCADPRHSEGPTYIGSDRVPAVIAGYRERVGGGIMMIGDVAMSDPGKPAKVQIVARGIPLSTVSLPDSCDGIPIKARIGRLVTMRRDRWRTPEGKLIHGISDDEIRDAVCGDFRGRDVPTARGRF